MGFLLDIPMSNGATAGYHQVGVLKNLENNGGFLLQTSSWISFEVKKAGYRRIYSVDIIIPVKSSYFNDFLTEEKSLPLNRTDTINAYHLVKSLDGTQELTIFGNLAEIPFSTGIESITAAQRDVLVFSDNSRIFNETLEKYQTFTNGAWVDE